MSFHAGPNDVLRPGRDVANIVARYEKVVDDLASSGAQLLLLTAPSLRCRTAASGTRTGCILPRKGTPGWPLPCSEP